jgi:hypothetical protein
MSYSNDTAEFMFTGHPTMSELRKDQSVEDYLFPLTTGIPTPPTILDIAKTRGAKEDDNGGINGAEFARVRLPLMGGCQICNATIAAYNAYPGINGYLVGNCCVDEVEVFETIEAFEMSEEE